MGFIDLHVHTLASDGLFTPQEVVQWAYKKNLKAIAITDHDTTDGIEKAIITGKQLGVEVIPGIEINTDYNGLEVHILGYYIDYRANWFQELLKNIRHARQIRAKKMVEKLQNLGLHIDLDEVEKLAGDASIGRPHIARILQKHNYVQSIKEAFDKYINNTGPAYVERYKITPCEAIKTIIDCGGVPVLAHPGLIGNLSIVKELVDCDLQGIEVYHSKHNPETTNLYFHIAKQYNLIITGGTDCHGHLYGGQPILGSLNIDESLLHELKKRKDILE
ncbi:PHP domain-containing protein [Irregularibacter muris]|uniref:PHP domain-containing protein n=1 Tax=Irregularibacter muris TaxID=1796619 RepID=A0AAE3HEK9_9FIRM|nr:PHP domain-containing protein [Irregularibacter muris]MCR1898085.1 PHP domain-containing protein [Irregularibacter muris]